MKLCEAIKILSDANVESAAYDARVIFSEIGKIEKSKLVFKDTESDSQDVVRAIERRKNREPLQYIIGYTDFYKERYKVTPDCLIPRQDTEILVEYAIKNIPDGKNLLDLCTGSGCIAISTLKNTRNTSATAIDISADVIDIARENAMLNGVSNRVDFILCDVADFKPKGKYFAILSNPPYVEKSAYEKLEPEIFFEPKLAFTAEDNGLEFYKLILNDYKEYLDPCGFFAFEIGFDQADALRILAGEHHMSAEIIKDYSGNDRVAVIRMQ